MKKYLLSLALFAAVPALAQDVIKRHNDSDLSVKVTAVGDQISYTFPGETVVYNIGRAAVESITYSSGRKERITDYIDISGPNGFQNVIITNNPNEIAGLVRMGEVSGRAGGYWSMRTAKGSERKAAERIKQETVDMGGHVLFIQQHESTGRGYYRNPESIQSGVAYGYVNSKSKPRKSETDPLYGQ